MELNETMYPGLPAARYAQETRVFFLFFLRTTVFKDGPHPVFVMADCTNDQRASVFMMESKWQKQSVATAAQSAGCACTGGKCRGLSFHGLPKDAVSQERRSRLLHAISRADNSFSADRTKTCSRHFTGDCFKYGKFCYIL